MSIEIEATAYCTSDYTGEISGIDGTSVPEALAVTDLLIFRILNYRRDVMLELESGTATDNDSLLTITDEGDGAAQKPEYTVRLAEGDMTFAPGYYRIQLVWVDDSETIPVDASKIIDTGFLNLLPGVPPVVVVP